MSISATHRNRYTCHFKHFIPLRLCLKGDTCSTFEKVLCDPCQDILGCVYLFSFYFYFCRFHLNHNFCGCLEQQAKVAFEVCFLLLLLFVVVVFKSVLFTFTEGLERRKRRHYYCYYFYFIPSLCLILILFSHQREEIMVYWIQILASTPFIITHTPWKLCQNNH